MLLMENEGEVSIGQPLVREVRVRAGVIEHGRNKKIIVFKYKNKVRYQRKRGHRQDYTRLKVKEIVVSSQEGETGNGS